jgi:hypothetical protein
MGSRQLPNMGSWFISLQSIVSSRGRKQGLWRWRNMYCSPLNVRAMLILAWGPAYIGGSKEEAFQLSIESFILGSLHSFNFFCNGPIKLAHRKKKKNLDLWGTPTNYHSNFAGSRIIIIFLKMPKIVENEGNFMLIFLKKIIVYWSQFFKGFLSYLSFFSFVTKHLLMNFV